MEQAAITGEPIPSENALGSDVYAGTINQTGTLQVRADRLGQETTFGKIIEAVEKNAERSRAPIQKTLVYFALGAAVLTFVLTHNIRSTISVVIVAGACGIAAGTPLAILGGQNRKRSRRQTRTERPWQGGQVELSREPAGGEPERIGS